MIIKGDTRGIKFLTISSFVLLAIVCSFWFLTPKKASAATFDLIQTAGDGRVFLRENSAKRHIRDYNTFLSWGFNGGMIRQVSRAEFDSYPTAPPLTTVMNYNGNVYAIISGMKAHVNSGEALVLNGFSWSDMQPFADPTYGMVPMAPGLTASGIKAVHIPSEGRIYYIENGYRRWIPDWATWNDWRPFIGSYVNAEGAKSLPLAPPLSRVLNYNGNVYVIINGGKAHVPSGEALILNGFSWSEMQTFADPTFNQMPTWPGLTSPRMISCAGSIYLIAGGKHRLESWETYVHLGWPYSAVSATACNSLPEGASFGRLIQAPNGQVYWIENGSRHYIVDPATFAGYGFNAANVRQVGWDVIGALPEGGALARWVSSLDGVIIPSTSGRTGKEQHLWTTAGDASDIAHYALTGVPATGPYSGINTQNGVAGTGAFGKLDAGLEKWYITMRWNYTEWYEDFGTPDSYGYPTTRSRNSNTAVKNWHLGKKVVVSNPKNNKKVVVAVGEAGPAIWVTNTRGVVSGLSPEATDYIVGASYSTGGDVLEYGWAVDQNLPLGPLNW